MSEVSVCYKSSAYVLHFAVSVVHEWHLVSARFAHKAVKFSSRAAYVSSHCQCNLH